jgi:hypothetical protein
MARDMERRHDLQGRSLGSSAPVNHPGDPQAFLLLEPERRCTGPTGLRGTSSALGTSGNTAGRPSVALADQATSSGPCTPCRPPSSLPRPPPPGRIASVHLRTDPAGGRPARRVRASRRLSCRKKSGTTIQRPRRRAGEQRGRDRESERFGGRRCCSAAMLTVVIPFAHTLSRDRLPIELLGE